MSTTHADGRAAGYSGGRTLPFRTELRRQLGRRRTQLAIGFLALLPVILVVAFTVGSSSADSDAGGLIELGTRGGMNFTVFALFMSVGFLLIVVVALFFGDTIEKIVSVGALVGTGGLVYFAVAWMIGGIDREAILILMRKKKVTD